MAERAVQDDDLDATIVVSRRPAVKPVAKPVGRAAGLPTAIVASIAVLGVAGVGGYYLLAGYRPAAPPAVVALAKVAAVTPAPHRNEAEVLAQRADAVIVARFADNPRIVVLDFPGLLLQGQSMNRMAAFLEKRGAAHDRVPTDQELTDAIRDDHSTVETYYYGHDYKAADIQRFFAAADRQAMALAPAERDMRGLLGRLGMLTDGAVGAIISIPREGSDPFVDAAGRASLLRHELSHGEYFTNPIYADFVRTFWETGMTEADRSSFRGFLSRQGYDAGNADLMANEMQAHLMHTTDTRYFNAPACGLPVARVQALRTAFAAAMPLGWLRDAVLVVRHALP